MAAALASVKDEVVVPWKQHGAKASKVKPVHHASGSVHHPDTGGHRTPVSEPAKEATQVTPAIATEGEIEPKPFENVVDTTANNLPAAKLLEAAHEAALDRQVEALRTGSSSGPGQMRGFFTSSTNYDANAERADDAGLDSSASAPPEDTGPVEPIAPRKLTRILRAKHFDTALGEIRPSSSEEGTIGELRKWAELYGEGGTKKGKKSGFGKGFGFGEEAITGRGFGRVDADADDK